MSDVPEEGGRRHFLFRTHTPAGEPIAGNSNAGHEGGAYGTNLPPADKAALLEYLKTF